MYLTLCVWMFGLHICLFTICMQKPTEVRRGMRSAGTGVTNGCEPQYGCWESSPGSLEEQLVLLTLEPFLQLHKWDNFKTTCSLPINMNSISQTLDFLNHHCLKCIVLAWEALQAFLSPIQLPTVTNTKINSLKRNSQSIW